MFLVYTFSVLEGHIIYIIYMRTTDFGGWGESGTMFVTFLERVMEINSTTVVSFLKDVFIGEKHKRKIMTWN